MVKRKTKFNYVELPDYKWTLIFVGVMIVFGLITIILSNFHSKEFYYVCSSNNWEGVHYISNNFAGKTNCSKVWEEEYSNGKWADKCSTLPLFSSKPSCHKLCVEDCKRINKLNKYSCVC